MDLRLETFPIQADCPATRTFYEALFHALGRELGVPEGATLSCGGGWHSSTSRAWEGREGTLRQRFAAELGPSLRPEQRESLDAALRELDAR